MIREKTKDIFVVTGIILVLLVTLIISSSQKEMSVSENAYAYSSAEKTIDPLPTTTPEMTSAPVQEREENIVNSFPLVSANQYLIHKESAIEAEMKTTDVLSNYSKDGLTIVWYTEAPVKTDVRIGFNESLLNRMFIDEVATGKHYIHSVKVEPLTEGHQYFYSGTKAFIQDFIFPKIKSNTVPQSVIISGTTNRKNDECLVKAQLERPANNLISTPVTTIMSKMNWSLNISNVLTQDFARNFIPQNTDIVNLDILCIDSMGRKKVGSMQQPLSNIRNTNVPLDL